MQHRQPCACLPCSALGRDWGLAHSHFSAALLAILLASLPAIPADLCNGLHVGAGNITLHRSTIMLCLRIVSIIDQLCEQVLLLLQMLILCSRQAHTEDSRVVQNWCVMCKYECQPKSAGQLPAYGMGITTNHLTSRREKSKLWLTRRSLAGTGEGTAM